MGSVRVSAPGKAILAGEHAAVWGRPALVAALSRRLTAQLTTSPERRLTIELAGARGVVDLDSVAATTEAARAAWREWVATPGARFPSASGDPSRLVTLAVGETLARLGVTDPPGLEVVITSTIPLGAGFGSSAALAVCIVQAVATALAAPLDRDELFATSLEVERRQHGSPSGVDNAAVIYGGVLWAERHQGALSLEPLAVEPAALAELTLHDSGRPAETTGEVVAAVRARHLREPAAIEGICDRLDRATREMRRALAEGRRDALRTSMAACEAGLEELGVVPAQVAARIAELARSGVAAKLSGAGALSGERAGAVLACGTTADIDNWTPLHACLGGDGVCIEEAP